MVILDMLAEMALLRADRLPVDLAREAQLVELPVRLGPLFDRVHVLVNNAPISPKRNDRRILAAEVEPAQWEAVLRVRQWGRILNVASRAGRSPGGVAAADASPLRVAYWA